MIVDDIQKELFALRDEKYASFQKNLIPTESQEATPAEQIIGVRTPALRDLASNSFYASGNDQPRGMFLLLQKYSTPIKRLITSLDEFREKKETYPDPEQFLEYLLSSVANEIDKEIESNKVREKKTKHQG